MSLRLRNPLQSSRGFTLVEMLVVAPILMLTIVLTISYLFNQYGQLTKQSSEVNLRVEAQTISFNMQDDIFFASAFVKNINPNLVDSNEPSGGWSYNTTPQTLIISTAALTTNKKDQARSPVYINTLGCSPDATKEQNTILQNNIIYFVNGTNLYKRTLTAPASMATCGTSYQKQTCPKAKSSTSCPEDVLLTDKLDTFSVTYYDRNNNQTSNPEMATKTKLYLKLKDKAFAEDVFADTSLTVKRLNQ